MLTKLRDVPVGAAFMFPDKLSVYEHRGNGWYSSWSRSFDGGPWHTDQDTYVDVDDERQELAQSLSCFI